MGKRREEPGIHLETELKYLIEKKEQFEALIKDLIKKYGKPQLKERKWFYFDLDSYALKQIGSSISLRPRTEVSENNTDYMLTFKIRTNPASILHRMEYQVEFEAIKTKDPIKIKEIVFAFFETAFNKLNIDNKTHKFNFKSYKDIELKILDEESLHTFEATLKQLALLNIEVHSLHCNCTFWIRSFRWEIFSSKRLDQRIEISCDEITDIEIYTDRVKKEGKSIDTKLYEVEVEIGSKHQHFTKDIDFTDKYIESYTQVEGMIKKHASLQELNQNKYTRVMDSI